MQTEDWLFFAFPTGFHLQKCLSGWEAVSLCSSQQDKALLWPGNWLTGCLVRKTIVSTHWLNGTVQTISKEC